MNIFVSSFVERLGTSINIAHYMLMFIV